MTISYTGNLKLALPITGTEAGTWGDVVNQQITSLLDQSVAGTVSLTSMTNADYTLTNGNGSTANEARYMALLVPSTLTLTAARNIIVPTSSKAYIIRNLSTGGFAVTLKTSGGTGISVPNGKTMALYCDGTNVIDGTDYLSSLTLGAALPVLSGGTGVTTSTGTGSVVLNTSPTLVTPILGTPTSVTLTNATGLPISTGVSGLGTGVATALAVNVGTAGAPVVNGGVLGTPSSGTVTNLTGTASININGTVGATTPTTGAFTTLTSTSLYTQTATEATVRLTTTGQKTYDLISGGGGNLAAGYFAIRNNTNGNNPFYIDPAAPANCVYISTTGLAVTGTLSATGGVTLSGGTANGVAYLDGSKVLTTGSALTFDGTNLTVSPGYISADTGQFTAGATGANTVFLEGIQHVFRRGSAGSYQTVFTLDTVGNAIFLPGGTEAMRLTSTGLGIGTSSPGAKLQVGDAGSTAPVKILIRSASADTYLQSTSTGSVIGTPNGVPLLFNTNDTERMRLDASGNLGIGITSPAARLDVFKASYVDQYWRTGGVSTYIASDDSQAKSIFGTITAHPLSFYTDGAEKMRLDASGNLGLGVTPSAWAAGSYPIEGTNATLAGRTGVFVATNWYYDGVDRYINSAAASRYEQTSGVHRWYNAPSGTAGNAITFTQAMTLDASGNLLVGTTSAAGYKFRVYDGPAQFSQATSSADCADFWNRATTGDNKFVTFYTEGTATARGSITYNRAGGLTVFNTTSDYRAKDIIGPVQNPGAMIDALKVYEGQMKGATQSRPMLIAHEAQAVTPYAVTGEKDAVNEDGTPKFQQMDVSALVPLLLAEIQDLRKRLAAAGI